MNEPGLVYDNPQCANEFGEFHRQAQARHRRERRRPVVREVVFGVAFYAFVMLALKWVLP